MISRASASDEKQVMFSIIDLLQDSAVSDGLDSFLRGDYFIVAGHDPARNYTRTCQRRSSRS